MARPTADDVLDGLDLSGRVLLVTGATAGIGLETARSLAAHGAQVHVGGRTDAKAEAACATIQQTHPSADVHPFVADLGDLDAVRAAAEAFAPETLHGLIANAGVFGGGYVESAQGIERTFAICHLAHFVLADIVLPKLRAAAATDGEARVVMVASESHRGRKELDLEHVPMTRETHGDIAAYDLAKQCNVLMALELDRREQAHGVRALSLHPGTLITTDIGRNSVITRVLMKLISPFTPSIPQGAATTVWAAVHPDLKGQGGLYLDKVAIAKANRLGRNPEAAQELWTFTEQMLAERA
jgi:WW domain-containing oxidoreductase